MTAVILFPLGLNATWMFPIIWAIFMIIPFWAVILLLKAFRDKNLVEIINSLLGKYLGFFVNFLLFSIVFIALILNTRSYADSLNIMVFKNTSPLLIYAAIVTTSYIISKNGIRSLALTAFVLFPIILFDIFLLFILTVKDYRIDYLYPIAGPGFKQIVSNGINTSAFLGEVVLISIFFPQTTDLKSYTKGNIFGFLLGCLIISLFFMEFNLMFGYHELQTMLQPFSQICRQTNIGIYIPSLDALFFAVCIIIAFVRNAFYIISSSTYLCNTLKIDKIKQIFLPLSFLAVLIGSIPDNPTITMLTLHASFVKNGLGFIIWAVPVLLLIVLKVKGGGKNDEKIS